MDAAIARMAAAMADRGVALRPHAKTHKSIEVGRRQVAAGAAGLTVGTIGEAEVFADGGLDDLFIAYPLVPLGPKAERLRALARRARLRRRHRLGRRRPRGRRRAGRRIGTACQLLVEIDSGGRRSGVRAGRRRRRWRAPRPTSVSTVIGVFTHGGHGYAGPDGARRGRR